MKSELKKHKKQVRVIFPNPGNGRMVSTNFPAAFKEKGRFMDYNFYKEV